MVLNPINRGLYEVTVVCLPIRSEFSWGTPHSFFMLFCVVLTIVKSLNSSIFRRKSRLTKKGKTGPEWPEARVFKVFPKIFALRFSGFGVKWKFISLIFACKNPMKIEKNCGTWVMGRNTPSQSDPRILELRTCQVQFGQLAWFFAC